jgi:hypothetical protein
MRIKMAQAALDSMGWRAHTSSAAAAVNDAKGTLMFYLTKRTRVADCKVGDKVMVLSDFPGGGIQAGEKGTVDENYERGIMVRWDKTGRADGFSEDELEFLAFGTESHPTGKARTRSSSPTTRRRR